MQVSDQGALAGWVEEVLAAHPAEVARFREGETKLMAFFVGQVMKQSKGKADPKGVQPVLQERLGRTDRTGSTFSNREQLIGSTEIVPYRATQCRCGPGDPAAPAHRPDHAPAATVSPSATSARLRWK